MLFKNALLCVIMCNMVCLGWTAEGEATADMPTVMEAIVHAMIDFRKEILDNLQLSLEFHTEQLEEIKQHTKYMIEEQDKKMKTEIESRFKELREEINSTLDRQHNSLYFQIQNLNNQSTEKNKMLREDTNKLCNETSQQIMSIEKALDEMSSVLVPSSCDRMKSKSSGIFYVGPYGNIAQKFLVFCNFDNNFNLGGNFTVFQRRIDGSVDFLRNWTMYKYGFGDIKGEHWLGLEKLHAMTGSGRHELLVLLEDFEGNSTYALYDEFEIASEEEKYKLTVGKYSGTAGDSLEDRNGKNFSTFDQDNGGSDHNLARILEGAWWFRNDWDSHLNGPYRPYRHNGDHKQYGLDWDSFRHLYSLKSATMMFRSRPSN